MCCWCCDRKSDEEKEYDASERERERKQEATAGMRPRTDEMVVTAPAPVQPARLFHAPILDTETQQNPQT